jgi:hypothetical protein
MRQRGIVLLVAAATLGCAEPNLYRAPEGGAPVVPDAGGSLDAAAEPRDAPAPDLAEGREVGSPDVPADVGEGQGLAEVSRDSPHDSAPSDLAAPDLPVAVDTGEPCTKCSDGTCIRNRYDFEDGSLDGVRVDSPAANSPVIALAPAFQGSQSLAVAVPAQLSSGGISGYSVYFRVCKSGASAYLRPRTFKARVYLQNDAQPAAAPFLLQLYSAKLTEPIVNASHPAGSWALLEGMLPAVEDPNVEELLVFIGLGMDPSWTGRAWIDDIRIQ